MIVPGAMADAEGWLPVPAALDTEFSVAVVNRRGRAPTDDLPRGSSVADEVRDVRAVLAELEGPFVLVGWSYGGLLVLEAAVGLDNIASLILYEPVCRPFARDALAELERFVEADDLDGAVMHVLTKVSGAPADHVTALRDSSAWPYLKRLVLPAATELSALNRHQPSFAAYSDRAANVTLLVGGLNKDQEPYGTAVSRFLAALPDVKEVTLPGQSHLAHVEAPDQLAKVVSAVVAETTRAV